jgi:two-component system, OmpR family, sensor kinase
MDHPSSPARARRAILRLPGRTPLRVQLIVAVLALVGVALVIISVAGLFAYRDYLLTHADQQVRKQFHLGVLAIQSPYPGFSPGDITFGGSYITAWRPAGQQLANPFGSAPGTPSVALPRVPVSPAWVRAHAGQLLTVGGLNGNDQWRVIVYPEQYPGQLGGPPLTGTLIVGVDLGDINGSVVRLATIDSIVGALVLAGLAIIGVTVVRASLRPLGDIERTAQAIAGGDLARRVPERDPRTEVGRLGKSLNAMLAQIETAFKAREASEESARRSEEAARQSEEVARQSEDAARRSARGAARSEERMRQFVADASHELRTPLTALRGFAEHYRQRGGVAGAPDAGSAGMTHAELDRLIRRVEDEASRMGVLVDDLLLLARLDQQRPMDFRTVDLLAIAADALHDARLIAPSREINLTVAMPDAPLVTGDEASLRQVVGNLMSNALTHTPDGTPIDITVRARSAAGTGAPDEPAVIFEVTDHGPGLTSEQQERVFERFYRTDRARSRAAGGTGLGLAIIAALVDAHLGRVWVESAPGEGATFGFAVPFAPEVTPTPDGSADDDRG